MSPTHDLVREFGDLVQNAPEFELKRWDGPLRGELGLKTRAQCGYVRLRKVLPGFVVEVTQPTWDLLETQGCTSLLQDRGHLFILFGPLSLVMDGNDDLRFGTVQGWFDWGDCEGSAIHFTTDTNEMVRLVRLGAVPRVGDTERMPRVSYPAGAEIVV